MSREKTRRADGASRGAAWAAQSSPIIRAKMKLRNFKQNKMGLQQKQNTEVSKGRNLVIKVWVLRVVKDCRAGSCGENWTSWLSIDAL